MKHQKLQAPEGTIHYRDALNALGFNENLSGGIAKVKRVLSARGLTLTHMVPYGKGYSYFVSRDSLERAMTRQQAKPAPAQATDVTPDSHEQITRRIDALEVRMFETALRIDDVFAELHRMGSKLDTLLRVWEAEVSDGK